ncbi:MAG: Crp/Fnr family transcriptional regulator [Acidobacteriaceae bacterium]|nr:Crp/Fnr family transcriptional regulator [Acidobacteriaceae bacterium]
MASQPFPLTKPATSSSTSESNVAERVVLMCASALFAGLAPKDCYQIASCASVRKFARDEVLFMQGQPVRNLVLLQTGSVKLTQLSPNGDEVILWMNGESEAVGVHGEAVNCSHTCSARAMEQCRALSWEYSRIQAVLGEYPQIRKNINQILSNNLQELEERFREVATERVARRLAFTLLRLLKHVGKKCREGVQLSLSREELAQMVGTTLFTISRILSKWGEEGLVIPRREAVLIPNPARLKHVSGGD